MKKTYVMPDNAPNPSYGHKGGPLAHLKQLRVELGENTAGYHSVWTARVRPETGPMPRGVECAATYAYHELGVIIEQLEELLGPTA